MTRPRATEAQRAPVVELCRAIRDHRSRGRIPGSYVRFAGHPLNVRDGRRNGSVTTLLPTRDPLVAPDEFEDVALGARMFHRILDHWQAERPDVPVDRLKEAIWRAIEARS